MASKNTLKNISAFEQICKKKVEEQIAELNKKAIEKALPKFVEKMDKELKNRYELSVDRFYESYNPQFYERRYSLYSLLQTDYDQSKKTYNLEFDPSKLQYTGADAASYSHGESGLYNTVFRGGFHGGAYHDGDFYWRKPYPYYTQWGRKAAYSELSILEDFKNRIHKYETGKMKTDFVNAYNSAFRSLG